jgi:hypothetical protein|tara:strand:- start:7993 stop:8457 length:465 start_codon:yes stop_codon:yes gene_type:complete
MDKKVQPVKVFNWVIEIDGIDSFECQSVTIPSPEIGKIEHGAGGVIVKTAGMVNVGDLTFSKLKPINVGDAGAWNWMIQAQDSSTGNGNFPQFYEKDITIRSLAPDNQTTLYAWACEGVFITKIEYNELNKTSEENLLETVTCSVDSVSLLTTP